MQLLEPKILFKKQFHAKETSTVLKKKQQKTFVTSSQISLLPFITNIYLKRS